MMGYWDRIDCLPLLLILNQIRIFLLSFLLRESVNGWGDEEREGRKKKGWLGFQKGGVTLNFCFIVKNKKQVWLWWWWLLFMCKAKHSTPQQLHCLPTVFLCFCFLLGPKLRSGEGMQSSSIIPYASPNSPIISQFSSSFLRFLYSLISFYCVCKAG